MLDASLKITELSSVLLVGGTSEIGLSILRALDLGMESQITLIGRRMPQLNELDHLPNKLQFVQTDLENEIDIENLKYTIRRLNRIDLAIVASGYLPPENCDMDIMNLTRAVKINSLGIITVLAALAEKVTSQESSGHILYISSVAAMRPRIKNFTYGASKTAADFFAEGLSFKYRNDGLFLHILRPGFVFTKMSKDFKPAPFAINTAEVAALALRGLKKGQTIIYAPSILKIVMNLLKIIPRTLFDWLK